MGLRGLIFLCASLWLGVATAFGQTGGTPANGRVYGSFVHDPDLPHALFLLGEITNGDSFELRRALRDHDIGLVVLDSPGGSVFEGLQIASILQDKALATYVPPGAMCASACSFVFFGGTIREVAGDLGVHQFYAGGDAGSEQVTRDQESRSTQYTASEIIGILNEFATPPFVYEKMFSTDDIYVFASPQKERLALNEDDAGFVAWTAEIDARYGAMIAGFQEEPALPPADDPASPVPQESPAPGKNPFKQSPPAEGSNPFTESPPAGGSNPFKPAPAKKNPFAPAPQEEAGASNWYVILGTFAMNEVAAAQRLQGKVAQAMWGDTPRLLLTDSLPGFARGHYILTYGPFTRDEAAARLPGVQNVVEDAYIDATAAP